MKPWKNKLPGKYGTPPSRIQSEWIKHWRLISCIHFQRLSKTIHLTPDIAGKWTCQNHADRKEIHISTAIYRLCGLCAFLMILACVLIDCWDCGNKTAFFPFLTGTLRSCANQMWSGLAVTDRLWMVTWTKRGSPSAGIEQCVGCHIHESRSKTLHVVLLTSHVPTLSSRVVC